MPHLRSNRLRRLVFPLALAALLVAGPGCDEKEEVSPEDQRLFLSAIPSQTCPAIVRDPANRYELDESADESNFELVATVFADDGQVQEGVEVMIESSTGVSASGETDSSGQLRLLEPAPPRPPDVVDWTASAENGEQSEVTTTTGFFPFLSMSPGGSTTVACGGDEFEVLVSVNFGCLVNATQVRFRLEAENEANEDVDSVEYLGASKLGALEFDEDSGGTVDDNSDLDDEYDEMNPVVYSRNGAFDVSYSRDPNDNYGITGDTALYSLTFRTRAGSDCVVGTALLVFEENGPALITPSDVVGGQYDLWDPPGSANPQIGPGILYTLTAEVPAP